MKQNNKLVIHSKFRGDIVVLVSASLPQCLLYVLLFTSAAAMAGSCYHSALPLSANNLQAFLSLPMSRQVDVSSGHIPFMLLAGGGSGGSGRTSQNSEETNSDKGQASGSSGAFSFLGAGIRSLYASCFGQGDEDPDKERQPATIPAPCQAAALHVDVNPDEVEIGGVNDDLPDVDVSPDTVESGKPNDDLPENQCQTVATNVQLRRPPQGEIQPDVEYLTVIVPEMRIPIAIPVPQKLQCDLCMRLFVNPVQTSCCQQVYCKNCLVKAKNRCPYCREEAHPIQSFRDQRAINNLPVAEGARTTLCDVSQHLYSRLRSQAEEVLQEQVKNIPDEIFKSPRFTAQEGHEAGNWISTTLLNCNKVCSEDLQVEIIIKEGLIYFDFDNSRGTSLPKGGYINVRLIRKRDNQCVAVVQLSNRQIDQERIRINRSEIYAEYEGLAEFHEFFRNNEQADGEVFYIKMEVFFTQLVRGR
ncbi:RING finger protein [Sansalvadorimonas verongulae]|uniref:RING finger protein n=1 Tax=Sansalvadorimonas verongulae TaxID=2172824 RepID=UPI0012BC8DCD|nr:RING finger protein [Sansalvadorimonas verongulae]MTI14795.1 hypothetical protein [Sansalvadorimonas verongulae]